MAKKSNTQLNTIIVDLLSRTADGSIPPSELRDLLIDIKDSYSSLTNHIDLFGLKQHNPSRTLNYQLGEAMLKNGVLNISKGINGGAFNQSNFFPLNKANIMFELPYVNGTQSYNSGTIMQYDYRAYKKLNTSIAGDPYDIYEYTELNVPIGYFGEPWAANTIYKSGMVVEAEIDSRKVYLKCLYENILVSAGSLEGLKSEWNTGKWSFVAESEPSSMYLVSASFTVNNSDHGKRFAVESSSINVNLPLALQSGWRAKFLSIGVDGVISFSSEGIITELLDRYTMKAKGSCEVESYGSGFYHLHGDMLTGE